MMPSLSLRLRVGFVFGSLVCAGLPSIAFAVDHKAAALEEAVPTDQVSKEIAEKLSPSGIRVTRGSNQSYCDIWFTKDSPAKKDFKPTLQEQFPFETGQFMGVIRYHEPGEDFRGQTIAPGYYVLRFALQPVDGNHVGTSETRDFYLVTKADSDKSPEPMGEEELITASIEALETTHPGMLALKRVSTDSGRKLPTTIHEEGADLWMLVCEFATASGDEARKLQLGIVVAGHAEVP
jgi:hypothetical protein